MMAEHPETQRAAERGRAKAFSGFHGTSFTGIAGALTWRPQTKSARFHARDRDYPRRGLVPAAIVCARETRRAHHRYRLHCQLRSYQAGRFSMSSKSISGRHRETGAAGPARGY